MVMQPVEVKCIRVLWSATVPMAANSGNGQHKYVHIFKINSKENWHIYPFQPQRKNVILELFQRLLNPANGRCLAVESSSVGAYIYLEICDQNSSQLFRFVSSYSILSLALIIQKTWIYEKSAN